MIFCEDSKANRSVLFDTNNYHNPHQENNLQSNSPQNSKSPSHKPNRQQATQAQNASKPRQNSESNSSPPTINNDKTPSPKSNSLPQFNILKSNSTPQLQSGTKLNHNILLTMVLGTTPMMFQNPNAVKVHSMKYASNLIINTHL